jgi:hypothetical protein
MKITGQLTKLCGSWEFSIDIERDHSRRDKQESLAYSAERRERLEMALEAVIRSPEAGEAIANAALNLEDD